MSKLTMAESLAVLACFCFVSSSSLIDPADQLLKLLALVSKSGGSFCCRVKIIVVLLTNSNRWMCLPSGDGAGHALWVLKNVM